MSEPFLGEISIFGFVFAPRGFAKCDGQLLPINQNQALFSLLGTTYGGDGRINFALPDLRGRTPVHEGPGFTLGQMGGNETHVLSRSEMPPHQHTLRASTEPATTASPSRDVLFAKSTDPIYHAPTNPVLARYGTIRSAGGSLPHNNMQPYVTLTFCIALQGLFPSSQ